MRTDLELSIDDDLGRKMFLRGRVQWLWRQILLCETASIPTAIRWVRRFLRHKKRNNYIFHSWYTIRWISNALSHQSLHKLDDFPATFFSRIMIQRHHLINCLILTPTHPSNAKNLKYKKMQHKDNSFILTELGRQIYSNRLHPFQCILPMQPLSCVSKYFNI